MRLLRLRKSLSIVDPSMPSMPERVKTYRRRDTPLSQQDSQQMEGELLKTLAICGLHSEGLHDRQTNPPIPHCSLASAKQLQILSVTSGHVVS